MLACRFVLNWQNEIETTKYDTYFCPDGWEDFIFHLRKFLFIHDLSEKEKNFLEDIFDFLKDNLDECRKYDIFRQSICVNDDVIEVALKQYPITSQIKSLFLIGTLEDCLCEEPVIINKFVISKKDKYNISELFFEIIEWFKPFLKCFFKKPFDFTFYQDILNYYYKENRGI